TSKGPVERQIVRILTPGTLTDDALLPSKSDRIITAVYRARKNRQERFGLAWMNLASGEFKVNECTPELMDAELSRLSAAELVLAESAGLPEGFDERVSRVPDWHFEDTGARQTLLDHFQTDTLSGFGLDDYPVATCAAGALLRYVSHTQYEALPHIQSIGIEHSGEFVVLDSVTRKNLEVTETISGEDKPTLFSTLDHCETPMGSRLLREPIGVSQWSSVENKVGLSSPLMVSVTSKFLRVTLSNTTNSPLCSMPMLCMWGRASYWVWLT